MVEKINQYLDQIESENEIKILLACETGSRAWGFPSPDSDYDIRILYVHKTNWYLSLSEKKDSIEKMFENNDLDITGWDIRKALRLLQKSNAPLLERLQSPIVYKSDPEFVLEFQNLANTYYSRIATIHHYLSMAKNFVEELVNEEQFKLKTFFYALRSAAACKWIVEREEIPPIEFEKMLDGLNIEKELIKRIQELIELKATISETYLHQGENELFDFIHTCISYADKKRHELPASNGKSQEMDAFFINVLSKNDN